MKKNFSTTSYFVESIFFHRYNEEDFETYYNAVHQDYYKVQDEMSDPIPFIEKYEANTMYYHQAIKQTYQKQSNEHTERNHRKVAPIKEVVTGTRILYVIW